MEEWHEHGEVGWCKKIPEKSAVKSETSGLSETWARCRVRVGKDSS